jgi:meso-butanediol dehydrogenase/(S,S)-butanediol dehydrogenase/diacetyl reductase
VASVTPLPLGGKVVFVTGGGRGIGRGIAEACAQAGADVGLGDLRTQDAAETARLVEGCGRRAHAVALDVTQPASLEAAISSTVAALGRLDGWVNNAGVLRLGAALDAAPEDVGAQMRVNAEAVLCGCQAAARWMIGQGTGGAIVNVASNAGKVGYRNMAGYNASKAAVISLTRSLSLEWAERHINVNAVCPGGVDTPMLREVAEWLAPRLGQTPDALHAQMKPQQMDRSIQPIEVGRVVAFLLSDAATIIRGQSINVDGGDTPY